MYITIKIIYQGYSTKVMRGGSFPVNTRKYKEDPDKEAARVTFDWMKDIRKEGHISKILKVTYNEDHDVTELVKRLDNAYLSD